MKRIILGAVILLVVLIAAIVACALISYHKQPELTADEIKQLDEHMERENKCRAGAHY